MYINQLKHLRTRKGITQEHIAASIGIERSHYGHYENGDRIIPLIYLNKICNFYDVSIDYVFELTEKEKYLNYNKEVNQIKFGIRFKEFRKENKLSQEALANKINIATSLISDYERGKLYISTHALYDVCKKYNISADYLLGKIDTPVSFK